jgi:hypothetical protein
VNCVFEKFQVLTTNATQLGNHHGIRSNMYFGQQPADPDTCQRVSGLAVVRSSGFVEWNWTIGWIFGTDEGGFCGADSHYHSGPFLWAQWRLRVGGPPHCSVERAAPDDVFRNMIMRDGDEDERWNYEFEGETLGVAVVDFAKGRIRTNTERHRQADPMFAEFRALRFQVAGQMTWFDFVDLRLDSANQDGGGWHCRMADPQDDTQHSVRQLPLSCATF